MAEGKHVSKLWQKGYDLNKQIEAFTVGNDFQLDHELVYYDCVASKAQADMLEAAELLSPDEAQAIKGELDVIIELHLKGDFQILRSQEDCHTAIEEHLTKKLGDVGKKIHTARSRNDQVLTALRLYYKDKLSTLEELRTELIIALKIFLTSYANVAYPGYTHMQKAMPSSFGLWANAFIDSMSDNGLMLESVTKLMDQSPLGTAAGYGVPLDIDRQLAAKSMGFDRVQLNPIYTQFSRGKLEVFLLQVLSQFTFDLNKIASDLILFNMDEFAFVTLPDEFCTGSSIMPQKKNPDVLELLRARHHEVTSAEFQVSSTISNLISGYNRDVQLTKEPVMKALKNTQESMEIAILLFQHLKVNEAACHDAMSDEIFATEKAYKLVQAGMPFRDAYQQVAREINKKK